MNVGSYLSPRSLTMRVVWVAFVPIWIVFTGMPSLSKGGMRGAEAELH
jgi:hypothetical protein